MPLVTNRQTLKSLTAIRPLYLLPDDPLVEEVLIPAFRNATKVDCMAGFFSSAALADLAPGLATYISATRESIRLIISPILRPEDQEAIEAGVESATTVARTFLEDLTITDDLLQRHTLKCLSWLLGSAQK